MKKFEINEAVSYIERAIAVGKNDFIIDTEFGRLVVDVDYENYGPSTTCIVEPWSKAPATRFNMVNINSKADYYVCIANPASQFTIKMRAIEAIYRVMFMSMLNVEISQPVVDACIMIHRREVEGKPYTVNQLVADFSKYYLPPIIRSNDMVQYLVRETMERRINDAKEIVAKASAKFDVEMMQGNYCWVTMDNFSREIFGLMIWMAHECNFDLRKRISECTRSTRKYLPR